MSKAREFWIFEPRIQLDIDRYGPWTHVIEYSVYKQLETRLREASEIVRHFANGANAWKHEGTISDFEKFFMSKRLLANEWLERTREMLGE